MATTRRGLFKMFLGALVAPKLIEAAVTPVAAQALDEINAITLEYLRAPRTLDTIFIQSPFITKFRQLGMTTTVNAQFLEWKRQMFYSGMSSSGKDSGLSRRERGFEFRRPHQSSDS